MITLGKIKSDNISRIVITLTDFFYFSFNMSDLGLEQSDNINRDYINRLLL